MKKRSSGLLVLVLILIIGSTAALAAGTPRDNAPACQTGQNFLDEDEDGICDNRENKPGQSFVDEDGDGICDNRGNGCGKGNGKGNGCGIILNLSAIGFGKSVQLV